MTLRMVKFPLIVLGIVAALFLLVYFGGSNLLPNIAGAPQESTTVPQQGSSLMGRQAPYFDLPDLSGTHVKSTQFARTPIVVVFWSTWNSQAADQIQILDQYIARASTEARLVPAIAINSQEERSLVSSFMNRGGYRVQMLLDVRGITTGDYQIKSLPTLYFIDGAGVVRDVYVGVLSEKMLKDRVGQILQ